MIKLLSAISCLLLLHAAGLAQTADRLESLSKGKTPDAIQELRSFLAIPNDALNLDDIDKNIVWLENAFGERGFKTEVLPTGTAPFFFAERKVKNAGKTILFYMHFDGQGVDPVKWNQEDPYQAVLKKKAADQFEPISWENTKSGIDPDWRVFARSSSDDKGPIVMFLSAIDIIDSDLENSSLFNIKVILDGSEEKGTRNLEPFIETHKDKLNADFMIINDGPIHVSERPTLVFGCRGVTGIRLTVYGPKTSQHSGLFGNYAPNPVFRMAHLLSGMKDEEGRVIIPGYYDGIDLDEVQDILKSVPDDAEFINQSIGIASPEKVGGYYQESIQYPSLNVRGMQSAWVGDQARTIVPDKAIAEIDIRLVPESDPERLIGLVREHIKSQGYYIIDREPTQEERLTHPHILTLETLTVILPFRTEIDSEIGNWLYASLGSGMGAEPVRIRIMGGTVPIAPFIKTLNIPAVTVPLVNQDNNQHAPNENLRIWNFTNGIQVFLSILTQ
ncbi:M20/M25/M40 family metallo-hydrolase [Bacteroidota bacterium]